MLAGWLEPDKLDGPSGPLCGAESYVSQNKWRAGCSWVRFGAWKFRGQISSASAHVQPLEPQARRRRRDWELDCRLIETWLSGPS